MDFRIYVADSLHLSGRQQYIGKRYYDIIRPRGREDVSAEEIVAKVAEDAGLVIT